MNSSVVVNDIKNTACFAPGNFAKLSDLMHEQHVPAGTYLFLESEPADKLFYLKKGSVKMTKSSEDGKQVIIGLMHEGDLFGQYDPHTDSVHAFSAHAIENSIVGVILRDELELLLWRQGDLALDFMKWLGLSHRTTQTKFRDLLLFGKPGALCSSLIRLCNSYGVKRDDGIWISKKTTNTELAEMIGATRESVNRMLGNLKRKKIISFDAHHHLIIHDPDYLRNICHCEHCPKDVCRI
jgi:CRP/FNR family transcriptional regulator